MSERSERRSTLIYTFEMFEILYQKKAKDILPLLFFDTVTDFYVLSIKVYYLLCQTDRLASILFLGVLTDKNRSKASVFGTKIICQEKYFIHCFE